MRDIKFRAWLDYGDNKGEMLPNIQNHINGDWAFGHIVSGNVENVSVPMQYTGIKDKNGVEIYEGDIVTGDGKTIFGIDGVGLIAWSAGAFVNKVGDNNYVFHEMSALSLEVIGNTHQNPELLGK